MGWVRPDRQKIWSFAGPGADYWGFVSHEQIHKARSISALHLRPRSGICGGQRFDGQHQGSGWSWAARPSEPVLVSVRPHVEFIHVGHGRFAKLRMEGWGSRLCLRLVRGDQPPEESKALSERRGRWSHLGIHRRKDGHPEKSQSGASPHLGPRRARRRRRGAEHRHSTVRSELGPCAFIHYFYCAAISRAPITTRAAPRADRAEIGSDRKIAANRTAKTTLVRSMPTTPPVGPS